VREPGILESFNMDAADAEALIMRARVAMGWVEAPEPEPEAAVEYSEMEAVFGHAPEQAPAEAAAEEPAADEAEAPAAQEDPEA
jgi:N utilization substance protein A